MAKMLLYEENARKTLMDGAEKIADAVSKGELLALIRAFFTRKPDEVMGLLRRTK